MERELARAHAFLALEEQRNADAARSRRRSRAPTSTPRRFDARGHRVHGVPARPRHPDGARTTWSPRCARGSAASRPGPREFFTEVDYRDPEVMRTHGYHWFDLARMAHEPHPSPIRRGPLLYNIFNTRTEGHATGWEEMMLQAGMFDARPRSRELIYILLAQRAARALGDLRMHGNECTLEQAAEFASANTPRGWLRLDGEPRPRRAAPLPAAARLRHELPHRQDRDRAAPRRPATSARRRSP